MVRDERKIIIPCPFAHSCFFQLRYPLKSHNAPYGIAVGTTIHLADVIMIVVRHGRSQYPNLRLYYGIRWGKFEKVDWVLKSALHRSAVPVPQETAIRNRRRRATDEALRHIKDFVPRRPAHK